MLDNYGRPVGYGQISPYRSTPNMKPPAGQPGRPSNLERAIAPQVQPQAQRFLPTDPNTRGQIQGPAAPQAPAAPAYQNVGHDGQWNGMRREQWRDAWMGNGNRLTAEQADEWLRSHGAREVNPGSGVWQTPHGETLDLQIARRAALAGRRPTITAGWGSTSNDDAGGGGFGAGNPQLQAAIEGINPFAGARTAEDVRAQLMQSVLGGSPDLAPIFKTFGIK